MKNVNLKPLMATFVLLLFGLISLMLPVSSAAWVEVLSVGGSASFADTLTSPLEPGLLSSTEDPIMRNCVFPLNYWQTGVVELTVESITFGGGEYAVESAIIFLSMDSSQDPIIPLFQQIIVATLNIANGAAPTTIEETLAEANHLLSEFPPGSELTNAEHIKLASMAHMLEEFNLGHLTPMICSQDEGISAVTTNSILIPSEALPTPSITPTPTSTEKPILPPVCVHPLADWAAFPEEWPLESIILGGVPHDQETLLEILLLNPGEDISILVAQQSITARLNVAIGLDYDFLIDQIVASDSWLAANPLFSNPEPPDSEEGIKLYTELLFFTSGEYGIPQCAGFDNSGVATATGTETPTSLILETPVATETFTPTPSVSLEPTLEETEQSPTETFTPTPSPSYTATPPEDPGEDTAVPPSATPMPTEPPTESPEG